MQSVRRTAETAIGRQSRHEFLRTMVGTAVTVALVREAVTRKESFGRVLGQRMKWVPRLL